MDPAQDARGDNEPPSSSDGGAGGTAPALPPRKLSKAVMNVNMMNPTAPQYGYIRMPPDAPPIQSLNLTDTSSTRLTLNECEWYWGTIGREDVKEKLRDTPDGTFLVRDASNAIGEYTLTIRKDGSEKLIKISQGGGKFGFSEPFQFSSVVELVNYFEKVSLKQYNSILDVKLLYPLSRFGPEEEDDENIKENDLNKIVEQFIDADSLYNNVSQAYEEKSENYRKTEQQIEIKSGALSAFRYAVAMFNEQMALQGSGTERAQPHELQSLKENAELLACRLSLFEKDQVSLQEEIDTQRQHFLSFERDINNLKPEVQTLKRRRNNLERELMRRGLTEDDLKQIREDGIGAWSHNEKLPHHDESTWYLASCNREEAEQLLAGTPTGTFLIRPRVTNYALSISNGGVIHHCIIYGEESGYGFAEPYNVYESLKALVLHYQKNSLEEHNDQLRTTLVCPINALNKRHIYKCPQQQQQQQLGSDSQYSG